MDSSVNSTSKSRAFNKSKAMIAGLIANEQETLMRFLSKEEGIYRILSKILNDVRTPEYIRLGYTEGGKYEDPVLSFCGELWEKGKFSREKLEQLDAEYDASLFQYVKTTSIRHIQDKVRAHNNGINSRMLTDEGQEEDGKRTAFEKATSKLAAAENMVHKFEDRDLLSHLISAANLNEFQRFIMAKSLQGYEAEEILDLYERKKERIFTLNYYYSQKSKAMTALKAASKGYSWR